MLQETSREARRIGVVKVWLFHPDGTGCPWSGHKVYRELPVFEGDTGEQIIRYQQCGCMVNLETVSYEYAGDPISKARARNNPAGLRVRNMSNT